MLILSLLYFSPLALANAHPNTTPPAGRVCQAVALPAEAANSEGCPAEAIEAIGRVSESVRRLNSEWEGKCPAWNRRLSEITGMPSVPPKPPSAAEIEEMKRREKALYDQVSKLSLEERRKQLRATVDPQAGAKKKAKLAELKILTREVEETAERLAQPSRDLRKKKSFLAGDCAAAEAAVERAGAIAAMARNSARSIHSYTVEFERELQRESAR